MRKPRSFAQTLGALFPIAALLAGCAAPVVAPGPYHIPADALSRRVDFSRVCVLENPAVKLDVLNEAIQDGIAAAGATYVPLPAGAGPTVCSYTLTYDVAYEGRMIRSITFYTFENGVPIYSARGTPRGSGGITFDMVSEYVELVIERSRAGRSRVLSAPISNQGASGAPRVNSESAQAVDDKPTE